VVEFARGANSLAALANSARLTRLRVMPHRADLAVVLVSFNSAAWLQRSIAAIERHAGGLALDIFVVDNGSRDRTRELVASRFPQVRLILADNDGFAAGNNRGIEASRARYVLLVNPDVEIVEGSLSALVGELDRFPHVGAAGVRQLEVGGSVSPTCFRFPSVRRALGEALFSERWPIRPRWAGERLLRPRGYERDKRCDWVLGSFLVLRREALLATGLLDERFFLYSEEPDLCLRMRRAGWETRYMASVTAFHYSSPWGHSPVLLAQDAFARRQYAAKHFGPTRCRAYLAALRLRHRLRAVVFLRDHGRRIGALRALRALRRNATPPMYKPPATAIRSRAPS
jgi:N-acetylglucosaminyl-diphospho-decaprenol L-rhamnosyltransferase